MRLMELPNHRLERTSDAGRSAERSPHGGQSTVRFGYPDGGLGRSEGGADAVRKRETEGP